MNRRGGWSVDVGGENDVVVDNVETEERHDLVDDDEFESRIEFSAH